jgi:hypothetical protein
VYSALVSWLENHQFPCLYKQVLGINCPICGFQRSLLLLMKGRVADSFSLYPPLIPILLLFIAFLFFLVKRNPQAKKALSVISAIVLGIVMVNYVFSFFRPGLDI